MLRQRSRLDAGARHSASVQWVPGEFQRARYGSIPEGSIRAEMSTRGVYAL